MDAMAAAAAVTAAAICADVAAGAMYAGAAACSEERHPHLMVSELEAPVPHPPAAKFSHVSAYAPRGSGPSLHIESNAD